MSSSLKPTEQFSPDFIGGGGGGRGEGGGGGEGRGDASVEMVLTVGSNGCVPLNKMAAMTIYGKIT